MAPFANRERGRVPLENDFAQERADWYNVMPAYLLLTEREFSTYSSQSHWPRCLLFPCSLTCSCRVASHCKVQGAVASSIRSAAWASEGGHARSARRGTWKIHMYACFRLLSLHARKAVVAIRPRCFVLSLAVQLSRLLPRRVARFHVWKRPLLAS